MVIGGPLISPVLIGRTDELQGLRALVEALASGRAGLALVAGEAGLGKSRLVNEILDDQKFGNLRKVRVSCLESDLTEPYALVLEIASAAGKFGFATGDGRAPEAERQIRRVQQSLQSVLTLDDSRDPLILVAEDLHWCDSASLSVLLGLVQRPGPLLLIVTYRSDEVTPDLAGFLAQASRIRAARQIMLHPFSQADTARMISITLDLDGAVPGTLLGEVMTATRGNPFLIEEMLGAWQEEGALERVGARLSFRSNARLHAPRSIRHSIDARMRRLSDQTVRVAELAAVVGDRAGFDFLHRLSGLEETELTDALRALSDVNILHAQQDGSLTFRHALTRQSLLLRMLEPERRSLHRRVAELLEAEPEPAPGAIAYQWAQAAEIVRAAPYALRAAEHAASLHAHREAIRMYELALAGGAGPATILMTALGDHHEALGEVDEAIDWYQKVQQRHQDSGSQVSIAEIDLRIGVALAHDRQRTLAIEHLDTAFHNIPLENPERWSAGLHLALQLAAVGRYEEAEHTLVKTLEITDPADRLGQLRISYELSGLRALRGDWQALHDVATQVIRELPGDGDEAMALRNDAQLALGTIAYYRGAFDEAVEQFSRSLQIAEQRGLSTEQAIARWNLATNAYYNLGRWQEAREELAELQALGSVGLAEMARRFEWWLDGEWEQAVSAWLTTWPALEEMGDIEALTAFGRRLADLLIALSKPQQALHLLEAVLDRIRAVQARSFEAQLIPREAEALAWTGDPRALEVCNAGIEFARELGARPCEALLYRARALVHRSNEAWAEAFVDSDTAIEMLHNLSMPYEAARATRDAGLIRMARGRRGDREKAAERLRSAQRIFADLGATRNETEVAGILSAGALAGQVERSRGPLTVRERQVAELVAKGLKNRDIASNLFITEKTAAYHVSRILTKLAFDSRSQIAAYMAQESSPPEPRSQQP